MDKQAVIERMIRAYQVRVDHGRNEHCHPEAMEAALDASGLWPVWQDISTAPRDGTNILVWWPLQIHCPVTAHWTDKWADGIGWKFTGWGQVLQTSPTHWFPLPPPPAAREGV